VFFAIGKLIRGEIRVANNYFVKTKGKIKLTPIGKFTLDYFGLSLNDLKMMSSHSLIELTKKFSGALDIGKKFEVSGTAKLGKKCKRSPNNSKILPFKQEYQSNIPNDQGEFSRYFDLDKWWANFIITPKASKSEKNKGLENFEKKDVQPAGLVGAIAKGTEKPRQARANNHPTVKPIKLMSYLITLGSREGDIILDPFMGSGTTCLSATLLGRKYIGIEREEEYCKIAEGRLNGMSIEQSNTR